ncbi:glycosyltransferase family 2 protein, partial [bacterium]|nr:glycosyltransferase family 2 protein [bacterium]
AREVKSNILIFMDADGQHKPEDISRLLEKLNSGYDMVIGARHPDSQASLFRKVGNAVYNKLASFMTGFKIEDLTSGFRVVKRDKFIKFLYLLPNGFSYPTTSTMAFFRSGYSVVYVPIEAAQREGNSHISLVKDGIKFFTIILKIGALFSPMRLFLPISFLLFIIGIVYYLYTFFFFGRFTNMSTLLFISSLFMFMMGIISEQISSLHYKGIEEKTNF